MSLKLRNIDLKHNNKQLALPLKFKELKNKENFIISECNFSALQLIENIQKWEGSKTINSIPAAIVYGPKGCGKSHLSSIFSESSNSVTLNNLTTNHLDLVKKGKSFVIDNFYPSKNYPADIVMHFLNQVTYNQGFVLFLSRSSPFEMDWELEDLNSRLRSIITSQINFPDDILLYSFLVKYSDQKQLHLHDKLCLYILERLERSFDSVIKFVDALDVFTLEAKKKVSYKCIKSVFNIISNN